LPSPEGVRSVTPQKTMGPNITDKGGGTRKKGPKTPLFFLGSGIMIACKTLEQGRKKLSKTLKYGWKTAKKGGRNAG